MSGPLHTVHVRVNDAATGQPTPVRIRFASPDGEQHYAPFGRLENFFGTDFSGGHVELDWQTYYYIDGTCEVRLPADPLIVSVSKGFEYRPFRQEIMLGPGKMALRLAVEHWADLRRDGWYSGDSAAFGITPHAALLEAAAEDLAVVNLLAVEEPHDKVHPDRCMIPNIVAFSGQEICLHRPGHLLLVNTCNTGAELGSLNLLNCHRPVYPLSTGCREPGLFDWTLADWCDQCHRKGGLAVWSSFGLHWGDLPDSPNDGYSGESLADLILGRIDAIEMTLPQWQERQQRDEWYRLLNHGFRVPLAGGSSKWGTRQALGSLRTYARLRDGDEFNYKNWIEAVRAGRTFVSNGPLLSFTVNEQDPGAVIALGDGVRKVRVRAEARSIVPFERLELVHNGEALAGTEASGTPCTALLEGEIEVPGSGWLAARCWGTSPAFAASAPNQHAAAHTAPVYVEVSGNSLSIDSISQALLLERLDRLGSWAEEKARFVTEKTKKDLLGILAAARTELVRRSAGPLPLPGGTGAG